MGRTRWSWAAAATVFLLTGACTGSSAAPGTTARLQTTSTTMTAVSIPPDVAAMLRNLGKQQTTGTSVSIPVAPSVAEATCSLLGAEGVDTVFSKLLGLVLSEVEHLGDGEVADVVADFLVRAAKEECPTYRSAVLDVRRTLER